MENEKKIESEKWVVTEVTKTTEPAIVNTEKQEIYTVETALARILNELEQIKKLLN